VQDENLISRLRDELLKRTGVDLRLDLWNGVQLGPKQAPYCIGLVHPWSARAALRRPFGRSVGEAYAAGLLDFEGDVASVIEQFHDMSSLRLSWRDWLTLAQLRRRLPRPPAAAPDGRRAVLAGRMHSGARDRAAIAFHYDLPQSFYEMYLGKNLTYSCAYFADAQEDIDTAQERKMDLICRKLRLGADSRLLDVGCGWGSLLIYAAQKYGVKGVGLTLSKGQLDAARGRVEGAGLSERIEIRLEDYRDIRGQFDAISSISMLEHVGPVHLSSYIQALRRLLVDGGLMLNHAIVLHDSSRSRLGSENDFIANYVFPDAGMVPAWRLVQACEQGDLKLVDLEQLGPHYALTLRCWLANLEANHNDIVRCASEEVYRIWRAYMGQSIFGFESEQLGVVQVLSAAHRLAEASLPLGRTWMSPSSALAGRE